VLDAFIIDELRRREQEERDNSERPRLELPIEGPVENDDDEHDEHDDKDEKEPSERGVVIINL